MSESLWSLSRWYLLVHGLLGLPVISLVNHCQVHFVWLTCMWNVGTKGTETILYIKANNLSVCLSVYVDKNWAVPGRFFQSLPVPCGAGDKQGRGRVGQGRAAKADTRPLDLLVACSNSPLICGPIWRPATTAHWFVDPFGLIRWLCERRIHAAPGIWARGQRK
jgi:hypothetical protein